MDAGLWLVVAAFGLLAVYAHNAGREHKLPGCLGMVGRLALVLALSAGALYGILSTSGSGDNLPPWRIWGMLGALTLAGVLLWSALLDSFSATANAATTRRGYSAWALGFLLLAAAALIGLA